MPGNTTLGIQLWGLKSMNLPNHAPVSWSISPKSNLRINKNFPLFISSSSRTTKYFLPMDLLLGFYWERFTEQTILFCTSESIQCPREHTFMKTSQRHSFTSGDLWHFSKRILLRNTCTLCYEVLRLWLQHHVLNMANCGSYYQKMSWWGIRIQVV